MTGTIKFFNLDKGWGFIIPDSGDKELWFHQNDVNIEDGWPELMLGIRVSYEMGKSGRGPCAKNVRKIWNKETIIPAPIPLVNDLFEEEPE